MTLEFVFRGDHCGDDGGGLGFSGEIVGEVHVDASHAHNMHTRWHEINAGVLWRAIGRFRGLTPSLLPRCRAGSARRDQDDDGIRFSTMVVVEVSRPSMCLVNLTGIPGRSKAKQNMSRV